MIKAQPKNDVDSGDESTIEGARCSVIITPYRDGPLLVRGPFRLQDVEGREIELGREIVALCRCGKSRIRPFCDGSHKLTQFRAPSGREERGHQPVVGSGVGALSERDP